MIMIHEFVKLLSYSTRLKITSFDSLSEPAFPTNVKVAELVSDPTKGLQVTWDNPNGNVDKYFVHYNTAVQVVPKTDAGGSTDLTDLIPGTQYTVYIESAVVEQSGDIINSTKSEQKVTRTSEFRINISLRWSVPLNARLCHLFEKL